MFALTPGDLAGGIIDCAPGPASFNAELSAVGHEVISCDPLYSLTADEIQARIKATFDTLVANARATRDEFVWPDITDFPKGRAEGRYLDQALPHFDLRDDAFDLALCSHFLFTYTEQLSADFHIAAIEEMCRVASESRNCPLLNGYGGPSQHLEPVIDGLRERGYEAAIIEVPYEFQRGGNQMLRVGL